MATSEQPRLDVVIVGGSIAGLCVGVALKALPQIRSITILERYQSSQLKDQGAGIRVGDEVAEFFQQYAKASMNDYGIPLNVSVVLNTNGEVLIHRKITGNCATTWIQLFRVLMLAFVANSCENAATCKYRYSCIVRDMVERDDKVEIRVGKESGIEETLLADLVIGADGASSKVREILLPDTKRTYAGYVLLRGLVPTEELSDEAHKVMDSSGTFCFNHNSQMLSYTVPGSKNGPPDSHNLLNWGWYMRKTEAEVAELMTDVTGKRHYHALPQGGMREDFADEIRAKAQKELSPQFAEAVAKTKAPFVQAITDAQAPQNVFWSGKIFLVGDAAGGQRPHTASAVTQACFHAHLLRLQLQGQMSLDEWSQETQSVSSTLVSAGQELGQLCLSETISPSDKARGYYGKMFSCQAWLAEKWKAFSIENGVKR